jgi:hypothetical protein
MSQTPDDIASDIHRNRAELRSNLQELEHKVKSATDWRQIFAKHPGAMTGAAFGVGALLATMVGGRSRPEAEGQDGTHVTPTRKAQGSVSRQKHQAVQSWDNIKSAVVGLAATKVTRYLGELMPGFEGELRKMTAHDAPRPAQPDTPLM